MKKAVWATAAAALALGITLSGAALADHKRGKMRGMDFDFSAIDTDGSGTLSRAEMVQRATASLSGADANGDAILTREELARAVPGGRSDVMRPFAGNRGERMANRLLSTMGAAEAGRVALADLAQQQVNFAFARADRNGDGLISQEEAARPAMKRGGWREGARAHRRWHHRMHDDAGARGRGQN